MRKRFILGQILRLCIWLFMCCSVYAQTESDTSYVKIDDEVFFYYENGDGTVSIAKPNNSSAADINGEHIPAEINGMPVTTIGEGAYRWPTHLGSQGSYIGAIVPEGVTTIEEGAFQRVKIEVTLPDSLTTIEDNAFADCCSVDFHVSSKNPNFAVIDNVLFEKKPKRLICGSAAKCNDRYYDIPKGILEIASGAFWDPHMTINIPGTVNNIKEGAIRYCETVYVDLDNARYGIENGKYLMDYNTETLLYYMEDDESTYLPERIKRIGEYSMSDIEYLRSITFPEGVEEIGAHAFEGGCIKYIFLPDSVRTIGDYAFADTEYLEEVVMSYAVTSIGEGAFSEAVKLKYIWLPDTLTELGEKAFYHCDALDSINIPVGIKTIKESTFESADLRDVYFSEGLEEIGKSAFAYCYISNEIVLPSTLKRIEDKAFMTNFLGEVAIPDSVEFIGEAAFDSDTILVVDEGSYAESWVSGPSNTEGAEVKYTTDDDWLNAPVEDTVSFSEGGEDSYQSNEMTDEMADEMSDFWQGGATVYEGESYYAASVLDFFGLSEEEFTMLMGEEPSFYDLAVYYTASLFGLPPVGIKVYFDEGILSGVWWQYSFMVEEENWLLPVSDIVEDISEMMNCTSSYEDDAMYAAYYWELENKKANVFAEYVDGETVVTFQADRELY